MSSSEVEFFGQRMTKDWADMLASTQSRTHYFIGAVGYARVPYGSETFREPLEATSQPCRHCSTIYGKLHEPMCDYEQCPRCSYQLMSCDCSFDGF